MKEYQYLTVQDVVDLTGKKTSWAYSLIRQLNKELEEEGYIIARGRIPARYFYKRMGLDEQSI